MVGAIGKYNMAHRVTVPTGRARRSGRPMASNRLGIMTDRAAAPDELLGALVVATADGTIRGLE